MCEIERLDYNEKKDILIPEFKTTKQWYRESGNQITRVGKNLFTVWVTETLIIPVDQPR